ncbi:MAG: endonuclease/exonuclease/phosphatase family protein [Ignavibacterium sp.]|nr:endonuclease/exonuclease/phosphatase family protein [Ignavibacterium sp.]
MTEYKIKLMTYNIGGGRKNLGSKFDAVLEIIKNESPDILAVQEAAIWKTLDGEQIDQPKMIYEAISPINHYFFGQTLEMREDFNIGKELFVHGIFNSWENWQQGNALFSRWPFIRLDASDKLALPQNIPLYKVLYTGNRETDPRYIILSKVNMGFIKAYVLITHLTTLYGERGTKEIPKKREEAQVIRWKQCERIYELTREYILEKNELCFLMGDFNAIDNEPAISTTLEKKAGFTRLLPKNKIGTHLKLDSPVDHIFIFPGNHHIKYNCKILDDEFSASDHNPVIANINIFDSDSEVFKNKGKGVFREDKE